MEFHHLPSLVEGSKKRIGRGHGSGKVKTAGRGQKGQKARGKVHAGYEGGQVAQTHRFPFLRGKGRNGSQVMGVVDVPLKRLTMFTAKETISVKTLIEKKLVHKETAFVKVIGNEKPAVALK